MTKDMTSGNPTQLILGFAVPLLLGNIFQQLVLRSGIRSEQRHLSLKVFQ